MSFMCNTIDIAINPTIQESGTKCGQCRHTKRTSIYMDRTFWGLLYTWTGHFEDFYIHGPDTLRTSIYMDRTLWGLLYTWTGHFIWLRLVITTQEAGFGVVYAAPYSQCRFFWYEIFYYQNKTILTCSNLRAGFVQEILQLALPVSMLKSKASFYCHHDS